MHVEIDSGTPQPVLNAVKVIIPSLKGAERHVTITDEGIIIDLVFEGEVVKTISYEHTGLDRSDEDG